MEKPILIPKSVGWWLLGWGLVVILGYPRLGLGMIGLSLLIAFQELFYLVLFPLALVVLLVQRINEISDPPK